MYLSIQFIHAELNWHALGSSVFTSLMPNSITLAGSELAPNMFGASSELVRSWLRTGSELVRSSF